MAHEIKQPVRGINGGDKSIGINKSNALSLGATTTGGGLAFANEFTAGSRISGPRVPQKPSQATRSRGGVATPASLRTKARVIVP